MIEISEVTHHFDEKAIGALNNISLRISRGSIHTILGPSGSGKSTLLKLIANEIPLQKGQIKISDATIVKLDQNDSTADITVKDFVFAQSNARNEVTTENFRRLQDHFNLEYKHNAFLSELSGGERRRVSLMQSLINSPDIVLLDEPFNGLDPLLINEIKNIFFDWVKENNITVVLTTHHVQQSLEFSDQITILKDGSIIQTGSPNSLVNNPKNAYCAQYFGPTNIKTAILQNKKLRINQLERVFDPSIENIELEENYECLVNFPPWLFKITEDQADFKGKIAKIIDSSSLKLYEVNVENETWVIQVLKIEHQIGQKISFRLDTSRINILEDVKRIL